MFKLFVAFMSILVVSCTQKPEIAGEKNTDSSANKPAPKTTTRDTVHTTPNDAAPGVVAVEGIQNLPAYLSPFVAAGYSALDTTSGDLNLDNYPDMIMVLKKNGEDTSSDVNEHPEKRPLLVLLGQPDKSYKLSSRSDNAVYCIDCGGAMGDPFMDVVIKSGYFSVEHNGGSSWRWNRTTTFKYSAADNNWFLHKDVNESFHSADPGKAETKVHTAKDLGKISLAKFDIYKESD